MAKVFSDFDVSDFWEPSEYAEREYTSAPPTDAVVVEVERQLGYKLPSSYVELMRVQNGGVPRRRCHRMNQRTSWSHDHIAITGIYPSAATGRLRCWASTAARSWYVSYSNSASTSPLTNQQ